LWAADSCVDAGQTLDLERMSRAGTAAVLSLVVPGVGQIYNGEFLRGIFWLIITPGFWIGSGGLLGWVCHLIASYTAYKRAELRAGRVTA
jgi:TM2 domain-containing membrane protein YozV